MKWKIGDLELSSKGAFILSVGRVRPSMYQLRIDRCVKRDGICACSLFEMAWGLAGDGTMWERIVDDIERHTGREVTG